MPLSITYVQKSTHYVLSDNVFHLLGLVEEWKNRNLEAGYKITEHDCMQVRQDAIKIAHRRTFDWIFNSQQLPCSDHRSKIAFTEWLENGSGIYWVTGKPGKLSVLLCLLGIVH
jgi:hypothetical protein